MATRATRIRLLPPGLLLALFITACGSDDGGGSSGVNLQLNPDSLANTKVSMGQESRSIEAGVNVAVNTLENVSSFYAWQYLDLNGDGELDLLVSQGVVPFAPGNSASNPLTLPVQAYSGDGAGGFTLDSSLIAVPPPEAEHPRKMIVMDFTGNGQEDIFIFDHGYDAAPFAGAPVIYLRSSVDGTTGDITYTHDTGLTRRGFHHCGAAGDIDNDGDIDVLVGGFQPFFYVNDGAGNFSVATNRLSGLGSAVFTCELFDIDGDGYLDILVGGHEWEGTPTAIFWGNATGSWNSSRRTVIPAVSGYGVVLDFELADFNNNGKLDLLVTRSRGPDNFYIGARLQLLVQTEPRVFADETSSRIDHFQGYASSCMPAGGWIDWMITYNNAGTTHIRPWKDCGLEWQNNGSGYFTLTGDDTNNFISNW